MAEMTVDMPKLTFGIKVNVPRGFKIRMALLLWVLRLAGKVSPPNVLVEVDHLKADDDMVRFKGDTAEGGKIVLSQYPEGYILRYHGEVVWREWSRR